MSKSKLYKLTDQGNRTQKNTVWGEGVTVSKKPCKNPQLYSGDMVYAYRNANLAFLLNPIHVNIQNPKIWEAEGEIEAANWGKVGCFTLTTIREVEKPSWVGGEKETLVRIMFAVLSAEAVLPLFEDKFPEDKRAREAISVARNYLDNPATAQAEAAAQAAQAAEEAAQAAEEAAEEATEKAAFAAAWATFAAAWAAARTAQAAAWAADAAQAAAWAADAASDAAAYASDAVNAARVKIDFCLIANKAVEMIMEKTAGLLGAK